MKKLIALFLPLLVCLPALAEDVGIIGGADGPTAIVTSGNGLLTAGLIVTVGGLAGTFLVLILFFLTIKLMQKILK